MLSQIVRLVAFPQSTNEFHNYYLDILRKERKATNESFTTAVERIILLGKRIHQCGAPSTRVSSALRDNFINTTHVYHDESTKMQFLRLWQQYSLHPVTNTTDDSKAMWDEMFLLQLQKFLQPIDEVNAVSAKLLRVQESKECSYCKSKNLQRYKSHHTEDCWLKFPEKKPAQQENSTDRGSPGIKCFHCKGLGHISRNCPEKRNPDKGSLTPQVMESLRRLLAAFEAEQAESLADQDSQDGAHSE